MEESVKWFTFPHESRVSAEYEEQPTMISRRKLMATVGAGVLLAASAWYLRADYEQLPKNQVTRNGTEALSDNPETYPVHENIRTTVFWVGEAGNNETNDNIHNRSSVWVEDWVGSFGGVDDPMCREDTYKPCGFEPKENPFYFALPFNDFGNNGLKSSEELEVIPWYDGDAAYYCKNRWLKITHKDKTVYAQWADAGPFGEDDAEYVFGTARPRESRAGLDVSPAVAALLGLDGRGIASWQFISEQDVPDGPWKEVITTSGPNWN